MFVAPAMAVVVPGGNVNVGSGVDGAGVTIIAVGAGMATPSPSSGYDVTSDVDPLLWSVVVNADPLPKTPSVDHVNGAKEPSGRTT